MIEAPLAVTVAPRGAYVRAATVRALAAASGPVPATRDIRIRIVALVENGGGVARRLTSVLIGAGRLAGARRAGRHRVIIVTSRDIRLRLALCYAQLGVGVPLAHAIAPAGACKHSIVVRAHGTARGGVSATSHLRLSVVTVRIVRRRRARRR